MRPTATTLTLLWIAACGAPPPVPEPPVVESAVREAEPPPPACPFDLDAVRAAGTVLNYAIADQPEASLRVWPDAEGDSTTVTFRYERRDEEGREEGVERYRCGEFGLALLEAGPEGRRIRFEPAIVVLPTVAESGQTAGSATLSVPDEEPLRFNYLHSFEIVPAAESTFEGEHVGVASSLTFGEPVSLGIANETTWIHAPGLLAAAARNQALGGGVRYAEQLRTMVPGR